MAAAVWDWKEGIGWMEDAGLNNNNVMCVMYVINCL